MKRIFCTSFGKDSTAAVILAHIHGMPAEEVEVVYSHVMYDKTRNISAEDLAHEKFIFTKAIPIFKSWGFRVTVLESDMDYLDVFFRPMYHPTKHTQNKGKHYGFCIGGMCAINRECKQKPVRNYLKSIKEPITQYVGICIDEPKRLVSLNKETNRRSILEEYEYTEEMARTICERYGLLSPIYNKEQKRGGCWMCPYSKIGEHRELRKKNRALWDEFRALEKEPFLAQNKWNPFTKETLEEREQIFRKEDKEKKKERAHV